MKLSEAIEHLNETQQMPHISVADLRAWYAEQLSTDAQLQHVVSGYEKMQAEYNADTEKLVNTQLELATLQTEVSRLRNIMHQMQRTVADCATDVSRWHDAMNS